MAFDPQDLMLVLLFAIFCYTVIRLDGGFIQPTEKTNEDRLHAHKYPAMRNRRRRILGGRRPFHRITRTTSARQPSKQEL